jgi:alpha-D-ribose 1-methylphosphonate 5-triphosphate synthase subunit PhnG
MVDAVTDAATTSLDRDGRAALLALAAPDDLNELARWCVERVGEPTVALAPETGLVMLQVREPVRSERFHLGEVVVSRAEVEWPEPAGAIGWAMRLGSDVDAAHAAAVCDGAAELDAAVAAEVDRLCRQTADRLREAADAEWLALAATRVSFEELD